VLEPIDLGFLGLPRAIGVYLVETDDGPALFDCGPSTTLPQLKQGLQERGLELTDIRHLLLSHIHFDHAGAAGPIVREHPSLRVWVSPVGARHLIDPLRLEASARRLWGDDFDRLFGELAPVPEENLEVADGDVLGWEAFPTPGHATHHVCYLRDGTVLAGDAAGVRILPSSNVVPPTPPPDIDVEAWHETIEAIRSREPERLALIHYGVATDADAHLDHLAAELDRWAELVHSGMDAEEFAVVAGERAGADNELYEAVVPYELCWQGLHRYWVKQGELG
jgi:glyoxylase-like metal-dependent hydrolase (beta-lactamase superfamily II)